MPVSVALMCALALGTSSPKEKLTEARDLAESFQFDKAIKAADAALILPDADHETLVALYELLGVAWATLDKPAKATTAFTLLLTIDPDHQLSKNLSPRTRTPFFEARSQVSRLGAAGVEADPVVREGGLVKSLGVTITDNTLLPARAVRFVLSADGAPPQTVVVKLEKTKHAVVPVSGSRVVWSAELLGDLNAVLRKLAREELPPPPPVAEPPPPPPLVDSSAPPKPASGPWLRPAGVVLSLLGGGAVIAGVVFGVQSTGARNTLANATKDSSGTITSLTQRQAQALDTTARTDATIANVLFISGGVVAATGVAFIIFGGRPDTDQSPLVRLAPAPAGAVLSGTF